MNTPNEDLIQIRDKFINRAYLASCTYGNSQFVIHMKSGVILKLNKGEPGYDEMMVKYKKAWQRR